MSVRAPLRDDAFTVVSTIDPADAQRAFHRGDPCAAALMRTRGFPVD